MVPLPLSPAPDVINDSAGNASLGMIGVEFEVPIALLEHPMHISFHAHSPYITVLAGRRRVIRHSLVQIQTAIAELVLAA